MLPRRAVAAIAATAIALALLLNFKTPTSFTGTSAVVVGQPSPAGAVTTGPRGASGGSPSVGSGPGASSAGPTNSTAPVSGAASGGSTGSSGSTGSAGSAGSTGSTGSGSSAGGRGTSGATLRNGRFTGSVVQIPFGNVQVQVTVQGGRIIDVQAVQLPSAHARSQLIGQYASPILRQEVLQAQSAQINLVSGATYTSEAYAQSLQAALDQAAA